jgi:hypothetical protein
MNDPLKVYLHDHLAGSGFAIELLETLEERYPGHETGVFAGRIRQEVQEDRATLEHLIEDVGKSALDLKDASAWLAEKASRAKLQHDDPKGIGAFEALEMLSLGIMGKLALWQVMPRIAEVDTRVAGRDYEALSVRAREQFTRVEDFRLRLAQDTFRAVPAPVT